MKKLSSINTLPEALSLFNLPQKFNIDDVNKKYRKLVLENHPDINQSDSSHEKMVDINQAKDLLLKFLENDQGRKGLIHIGPHSLKLWCQEKQVY